MVTSVILLVVFLGGFTVVFLSRLLVGGYVGLLCWGGGSLPSSLYSPPAEGAPVTVVVSPAVLACL